MAGKTKAELEQAQDAQPQEGDLLDLKKFNDLPGPVTARMCGGRQHWIEGLCVQTGVMRLDVSGQIDLDHFGGVMELIDADGCKHDPDEFYL